ncbi:hypothetical protein LTR05_008564 [Lithohypha guttulata]|uniref:Uncharacterized protein n=1 Tax=Lithohypha guttulata TaxID=1690604 RepID=A0AAN7PQ50_9EURO|nr:hypothetical protein LTR05_008564 [Lithohypha guttulata]
MSEALLQLSSSKQCHTQDGEPGRSSALMPAKDLLVQLGGRVDVEEAGKKQYTVAKFGDDVFKFSVGEQGDAFCQDQHRQLVPATFIIGLKDFRAFLALIQELKLESELRLPGTTTPGGDKVPTATLRLA